MNPLAVTPSTITALVVAVSFAAGLNVYATVLSLGVMARMHWVALPSGLESLQDTWIIVASAILFAGEFVADKIPGFDVIWNALHTFVRIPLAALMAYAATSHLSIGMQLVVTCLGAVVASIAHGTKTAARVAVTPSPEPVSNIALSTAEDGLVVGLMWVATHHPYTAAGAVVAMLAAGLAAAWWGVRMVREGWKRRFGQPRQASVMLPR